MTDYNEPISDAGHVVGDGLVQRIRDLEAERDEATATARRLHSELEQRTGHWLDEVKLHKAARERIRELEGDLSNLLRDDADDWVPDYRHCDMGVGCDEVGVCYAEASDQPERCPSYPKKVVTVRADGEPSTGQKVLDKYQVFRGRIDELNKRIAALEGALKLCVDALTDSAPVYDDYWAAVKAGEDTLVSGKEQP